MIFSYLLILGLIFLCSTCDMVAQSGSCSSMGEGNTESTAEESTDSTSKETNSDKCNCDDSSMPQKYSFEVDDSATTPKEYSLKKNKLTKTNFQLLQYSDHGNCIASSLKELATLNGYFDAVLMCEGHKIVAHKLVLSSASNYLKSILEVSLSLLVATSPPPSQWHVISNLSTASVASVLQPCGM